MAHVKINFISHGKITSKNHKVMLQKILFDLLKIGHDAKILSCNSQQIIQYFFWHFRVIQRRIFKAHLAIFPA